MKKAFEKESKEKKGFCKRRACGGIEWRVGLAIGGGREKELE